MNFEYTISMLREIRKSLMKDLKGNQNKIDQKIEIERAITALELLDKNDFQNIDSIRKLPYLEGHGYYEYMLMIDNESGNPKDWVPYTDNAGNHQALYPGDIILSKK